MNKFFKLFIYNYANAMYSKWVNVPKGEDLDHCEESYRPGCIGSMDVTHIYWDKCPEAYISNISFVDIFLFFSHLNKEKYKFRDTNLIM